MHLDTVVAHRVKLPFSFDFSHSLRKRSYVDNIIVEIIAEQGKIIGYGEGAPRSYVTGESIDSTVDSIRRFTQHKRFPRELVDISQIWDLVDGITNGKKHNSAVCAIETALLDAWGKNQNRYVRDYFAKDFMTDSIHYGAAIPLDRREKVTEMCRLIKTLKINTLRLKLGKDIEHNKTMLEIVRLVFGNDYDLRVDINCGWDKRLAVMHIPLMIEYNVKAIEQPMMPDDPDIADFAQQLQQAGVMLMADESACSLEDVQKIVKEKSYKMINIRLSKCGGFRNSLKMIDDLRLNGVPFQIGCQLGESGVLSAAGRILCLLCRDAVYYDGSYDRFLLQKNVTAENVSFDSRGKAGPLNRPGLGVAVNSRDLQTVCRDSIIISSFNG